MDLYLVRHGEARPEQEDPLRPLSERGKREVERVARALARTGLEIVTIRHSGKLRARQTAEILARALGPGAGVMEMAGLAPDDEPALARDSIVASEGPEMLVGHLPHLSRLASLLLLGDASREVVPFGTAEVIALAGEGGAWRLRWAVSPASVPGE